MKVEIDPEVCTGCGLCTETCPEVFDMQGELAVAKTGVVPAEAEEPCRRAVEECPVSAILIID